MTVRPGDLARIAVLAPLPESELERLAGTATRRTLADGEAIFKSGDAATSVFAIARGRLVLRATADPRSTIVMIADEGELLGWIALGEDARWLTTGRAAGEVEAIVLPVDALLSVVSNGGPEARRLVGRLFALAARHLEATQAQLLGRGGEGVISGG